jgi:hypothetical protein
MSDFEGAAKAVALERNLQETSSDNTLEAHCHALDGDNRSNRDFRHSV